MWTTPETGRDALSGPVEFDWMESVDGAEPARGYTVCVTQNGANEAIGESKVGKSPTVRLVAVGLILRGNTVLICQRRPDQPMALQWEFPGGKIEPGETAEQALHRELMEELRIDAEIGPQITHIRHTYRHGGAVDLQFFAVNRFSGEIGEHIFHDVRWVTLEELPQYDFLAADRGLIADLASGKLL